jgi:arylsulfatase A-like enzyme
MSYDHWSTAPADQKAARLEEFRRTYLAGVPVADTAFGKLLDELDATGLTAETVVVLASDHGELIGEHNQIGHMGTTAEALTHVPLVVRYPGTAPRRERKPASMIDIAPTLAAIAGTAAPSQWQGTSLLEGGSPTLVSERDAVLSLSDGRWKVTEKREEGAFLGAWEIAKDPAERARQDATANPAIGALVAAGKTFRAKIPSQDNQGASPTINAEEKDAKMEELRLLGYVE